MKEILSDMSTTNKLVIKIKVNGQLAEVVCQAGSSLLDVLRDYLQLTGSKKGCGSGDCGACTVIVDQKAVCSCIYLAAQAAGKEVLTVEGLASENELHPLQKAFIKNGAAQCGFCIPGILMSSKALVDERPDASEQDIREALGGNLCRCTGYVKIVQSVREAAAEITKRKPKAIR